MINEVKEKAISKGMKLLNSPTVEKMMESEQVGKMIETAMSVPIKLSDAIRTNKQKFSEFMEVATRDDVDELKRTLSRMEDELITMKNSSKKSTTKKATTKKTSTTKK